jgi:hypothetical protein
MEIKTMQLTIVKASEGMWLYDGVTEPCKWARLAEGQTESAYHEISEVERQQILSELEANKDTLKRE